MKTQVSQAEVIFAALDARMTDVHTVMVGRVVAVNLAARKVDVQPVMQRVLQTEEGDLVTEALPALPQVPLGALRAGSARIDMPVQPGHWVVVFFFEDNIGKWLAAGGVGVSPGDVERHGLTGAVAVPLLWPDNAQPAQALDPANIVITAGAGEVHIGESAGQDYVALAAKVATELDRIKTDLTTLKAAIAAGLNGIGLGTAASGTAGAAAFNAAAGMGTFPSSPVSVAAAKVKAT
ncbi:MAG TPA: Gp138 family membrane-puncturing spike protein [Steroidobacteraceae bacterium]|jgi:hypothetical protein|nr:Gp138 family membrane-puncturing spike protein [Steroidobacteraceae bacterium]